MARDFGEVAEQLRRSTVQILTRGGERGSGSGVIWSSGGLIVTNAHVARGDRARVQLWDGRTFEGELQARDERRDLASLQVQASGLPAASPANSAALKPGELVVAVGNPLGFMGALTTGVIHGVGPLPGMGRRQWVQAAVRLAPGNSGGPLANASGEVIGLNTMITSGGLALAVPSNVVAEFLAHGSEKRISLGVTLRPVRVDRRTWGLMLLEITPGSPAAQASLLIGDVLLGADGRRFASTGDLAARIENGGILRLQFIRGGQPQPREVAVQIGQPSAEAA